MPLIQAQGVISAERVRQARELRGISQEGLAERIGITQPAISQIEAGLVQPSSEVLAKIAMQTGFPLSFFRKQPPVDFPVGSLMYRARRSMANDDKRAALRYGQLLYEIADSMASKMKLPPQRLPRLTESPKIAAQMTRAALGLSPDMPIANLINTIERAGVFVLMLPVAFANGDAFSVWASSTETNSVRPTIVLFDGAPGDRLRLNIAHELCHLVLHPHGTVKRMEDEAYAFACELLVPEVMLRQEMIAPVTLAGLARLKVRWGISINALTVHAHRLGILTKSQYEYLRVKLRQEQWLFQEPQNLAIPVEKPRAVRKMAELMYGNPIDYLRLANDANVSPQMAKQLINAHASREEMTKHNAMDASAHEKPAPFGPAAPKISSFRSRDEWDERNRNIR